MPGNYLISATSYNWQELNGDAGATLFVGSVAPGNFWAAPVNLGSHTFRLYGSVATGNSGSNSLYGDTSGWLFTNPATMAYDTAQTDLSVAPAAAVVAPLWHAQGGNGYFVNNPPNTMLWWKIITGGATLLAGAGKDEIDPQALPAGTWMVVEWNQVFVSPSGVVPFTFEALMQLDTGTTPGDIIFQYNQLDGAVGATISTVGVKEAGASGPYARSSYNAANPLVGVGQAILFHWSATGMVAGGSVPVLHRMRTGGDGP